MNETKGNKWIVMNINLKIPKMKFGKIKMDTVNEIEEMKVTIEIVNPSIDTRKSLGVGQVYTVAKQTRLAYVCEFNDSYQTTVKVDCTTGDILGYDMLN